jgi:two-component system cell cycle response regulator
VGDLASSRILLMSRLAAAHCQVVGTPTAAEAVAEARAKTPDLVLVDLAGSAAGAFRVCRALRAEAPLLPVLALASAPEAALRQAALAAGADDILDRDCGDSLLHARVRALMRARNQDPDLLVREDAREALGFGEPAAPFEVPGLIGLVAGRAETALAWREALAPHLRDRIEILAPCEVHDARPGAPQPDVYVIETDVPTPEDGLALVTELRAHPSRRTARILALAPEGAESTAAAALDLGADDAVVGAIAPLELVLRIRAQLRGKARADRLRRQISDGLRLAVTDPLTGLFNRRYAMSALARIAEAAAASGRAFAVMVIDLDRFKAVNDRHGHAAGDAVLVEASRRIAGALRSQDLVARLGGEEFLAVMPETGVAEAEVAAERVRRAICSAPFRVPGVAEPLALTTSIGVAVGGSRGESGAGGAPHQTAGLVEQADRALYAAKARGRNRVTLVRPAA